MSVDLEKSSEYSPSASGSGRHSATSNIVSPAVADSRQPDESRRWKLDMRAIPTLSVMYLLYTLDRSAIDYAVDDKSFMLFGTDHGTSRVYKGIYYLGFCLFVLPTALLLPKLGSRTVLPLLMACWGAMTMIEAGASSWAGLAAVQFFVGAFQSGFWACVVVYLSDLYKRNELGLRLALVFGLGTVLGSFNGAISYSVLELGSSSLAGWKILVLIEGGITIGLAPVAFLVLPRSFERSEDAQAQAVADKKAGRTMDETIANSSALTAIFDKHTIAYAVIAVFLGASASSCELVIYQMMKTLSTGTMSESLNTVAIYAFGFFILMFLAASSDFYHERSTHIGAALTASLVAMVNLTLVYYIHKRDSAWFCSFMLAVCVFITPLFHAWYSNNTATKSARVGVVGIVVGAFHVGDLFGWLAFWNATFATSSKSSTRGGGSHKRASVSARAALTTTTDDLQGLKSACAYMVVAILAIFAYGAWLKKENRKRSTQQAFGKVEGISAGSEADGRGTAAWRWTE
ncbi:hypothetical protein LTR85_000747 [Meristemomyces frigidus]|nr:hypothetical protein LTR85_000747 [Meristemomyces frigidus]